MNVARAARTAARCYGEDRGDRIRAMPCAVAELLELAAERPELAAELAAAGATRCTGRTVAAHARARGMGGAKGTHEDLVPLCWSHHLEAGERGTDARERFQRVYRIDLEAEAARLAR